MILLVFCSLTVSIAYGQIEKGIVDLRNLPDDYQSRTLDGDWEFYWMKLLSPGEVVPKDSVFYQKMPQMWNSTTLANGESGIGMAYASYRLTVLLDKDEDLSIFTPAVYNAYAFYINGHLIS